MTTNKLVQTKQVKNEMCHDSSFDWPRTLSKPKAPEITKESRFPKYSPGQPLHNGHLGGRGKRPLQRGSHYMR